MLCVWISLYKAFSFECSIDVEQKEYTYKSSIVASNIGITNLHGHQPVSVKNHL